MFVPSTLKQHMEVSDIKITLNLTTFAEHLQDTWMEEVSCHRKYLAFT